MSDLPEQYERILDEGKQTLQQWWIEHGSALSDREAERRALDRLFAYRHKCEIVTPMGNLQVRAKVVEIRVDASMYNEVPEYTFKMTLDDGPSSYGMYGRTTVNYA